MRRLIGAILIAAVFGGVAGRREPLLASPNLLKRRRPARVGAGRVRLRIESSTTKLRWLDP